MCLFIETYDIRFNCLLVRELRLDHVVRMWDSYLSDGYNTATERERDRERVCIFGSNFTPCLLALASDDECGGFSSFHVYVCAAFLCRWSRQVSEIVVSILFLIDART